MKRMKTPGGILVATNPAACASERRQPYPRVESEEAVRMDKAVRAPAAMNNLPLDWEEIQISDVTVRAKQRDPRRQPTMRFRYVDVSSVSNSSFRIVEATEIEGSAAPSRARKEICAGDVLFATVRPTLKRVALVPPELHGQIASTGFIVLRADPEKLNPRYLYNRLLTDAFIKRMRELERGASYPAVRDTDVLNEVVPVPPLAEQRKIAGVLGVVQRAMEQQERLIALTAELKKTLLHKLFTEGLRGEPQKQTDIGPIPESWDVMKLRDLCDLIVDCPHTTPKFRSEGIRVARNFNIRDGRFVTAPAFYTTEKEYQQRIKRAEPLPGDILFSREAPVGEACAIPDGMKLSLGQRTMLLRASERKLDAQFMVYCFYAPNVRPRMLASSSGLTVPHLNVRDVRDLSIPIPLLCDQQQIATAILTVDTKCEGHRKKHAALTALFRTLLHQLMTAQIRVHDLDLPELKWFTAKGVR
jgi:type I restriction enzyme S subunit